MRIQLSICFLTLVCYGCTHNVGRDFQRPDTGRLIPGKTVKSEVTAAYGPPDSQASSFNSDFVAPATQPKSEFDSAVIGGAYSTLVYQFVQSTPRTAGGSLTVKRMVLGFRNNTLIGYNFTSNFPNESSNFDESKISLIEKGKTTESEVKAMLGQPTGEAVYPAVLIEGEKEDFYSYLAPDMATRKVETKDLRLLFKTDGKVIDFRFNSRLSNMPPAPAAPAPAFVPIMIPVHK